MVCKVVKPIYGMAQAGRRWQRSIFPWLQEFGFKQCESDPCLFVLDEEVGTPNGPRQEKLVIGCYVDDLATVYTYDDEHSLYTRFVTALTTDWAVEDEGELTDLLGVDFTFEGGTVQLKQTRYIERLEKEFLPDGIPSTVQSNRPPCTPALPQLVADALSQAEAPDVSFVREYQRLVGALLYAVTNTRPDGAYAVGMLCRAMAKPTPELRDAALDVLRYFVRTKDLGLCYEPSDAPLYGMSDSDWATRHSTSGHVFVLNKACISWGSRKQGSIALSSCEAEIMAGSEAAKEAVSLDKLARELGITEATAPPVDLFMDNKAAIDIAYNPEHHSRMKHVERRHFFIRELVENLRIRVPFVSTTENLADFFTKPLPARNFFPLRDIIMNTPHSRSSYGGVAAPNGARPRGGVKSGRVAMSRGGPGKELCGVVR